MIQRCMYDQQERPTMMFYDNTTSANRITHTIAILLVAFLCACQATTSVSVTEIVPSYSSINKNVDAVTTTTKTIADAVPTASTVATTTRIVKEKELPNASIDYDRNKINDEDEMKIYTRYTRGGDRRRQQQQQQDERNLPGNEMYDNIDMNSAEAGFIVGVIFIAIIILCFLSCLCNCLCGGGRRGYNNGGGGSSCLWDLVAIVCLWELCCDNDGIMGDGFMRF